MIHTWMGPESNPEMPEFIKLFNDYHRSDPDTAFVAVGWDTIMRLAQAIEMPGHTVMAHMADTSISRARTDPPCRLRQLPDPRHLP